MKKIILFNIIALIAICNQSFSQAYIGISPGSKAIKDTIQNNDTVVFNLILKNHGPDPCKVDSIKIFMGVIDSSGQANVKSVFPININKSSLFKNDTALVEIQEIFSESEYKRGIDVVVVWPVSHEYNVFTIDTIFQEVLMLVPTGIHEFNIKNLIHLYPNPTEGNLCIENENSALENTIEQVRILDLSGRLINSYGNSCIINMDSYKPGAYLMEITLKNQTKISYKILKQGTIGAP